MCDIMIALGGYGIVYLYLELFDDSDTKFIY